VKTENGGMYNDVELRKKKINELKDICEQLGISKAGKKEDLIERIINN